MSTQQDINAIRAQRSSHITYIQHTQPNNNFVQQPSFNTNYMQQPMLNPEDISDPTNVFDMALKLMSKAFQLNNITPTNNNQRSSSTLATVRLLSWRECSAECRTFIGQNTVQNQGTQNVRNHNGLSVVLEITNQHGNGKVVAARAEGNSNGINGNPIRCYICQGEDHYASNCTVKPRKQDAAYLQKQMQIAQKEEAGIQLTSEEFNFMATGDACEETEKVTANCNLQNNLQLASTSEEQYTELLEPITEPHQVQQNYSKIIFAVSSVEQGGGTVEQHSATVEETRAYHSNTPTNNLNTFH
ncbi:reverse transcriptase domain-containing protein [Tanacetum coccineum]|uniref:Reverse transcriptase domain-containing protein n=1 Tax=Tanacetum coccineum TaxID=301880 RepID=A0ABQ5EAH7_9ASTR